MGYGNICLTCQQTSWDGVYSVVKCMRQSGIDSISAIFRYAQKEYSPLVDSIRSQLPGEDGPALEEPPSPCYSYYGIRHKGYKGSH